MRRMYIMLSIVGWAWLLIVGGFLIFKFQRLSAERRRRGFAVIEVDGNKSQQTHGQ
jgi:hypothetical protein